MVLCCLVFRVTVQISSNCPLTLIFIYRPLVRTTYHLSFPLATFRLHCSVAIYHSLIRTTYRPLSLVVTCLPVVYTIPAHFLHWPLAAYFSNVPCCLVLRRYLRLLHKTSLRLASQTFPAACFSNVLSHPLKHCPLIETFLTVQWTERFLLPTFTSALSCHNISY